MPRILLTWACFCSVLLLSGALGWADAPDELPVREKTLSNGFRILVWEKPIVPRVACRLFYRVGSVNERPGWTGISHLLEHMMFKGTRVIGVRDPARDRWLTAREDLLVRMLEEDSPESGQNPFRRKILDEELQDLRKAHRNVVLKDELWETYLKEGGTALNAFTSEDLTGYIVTLPSNRLELFFWMESDRIEQAVFREFYSERAVVMEERRLQENRPDGPFYETLNALFFDAHPYGWPVVGWMSDLRAVSRQAVQDYYEMFYNPNNAVLALAGDLRAEEAFLLGEKYFGSLPNRRPSAPRPVTEEPEPRGEKRYRVSVKAHPRVLVGFHTPPLGHADTAPLDVLSMVLSGRAGRLYRSIVREKELASSVQVDHSARMYAGEFWIEARLRNPHTPTELEEALFAEIARLEKTPPTPDELERAKNQLERNFWTSFETLEGAAGTLASYEIRRSWRYLLELRRAREATTASEVERAARTYLRRDRSTVGILERQEG